MFEMEGQLGVSERVTNPPIVSMVPGFVWWVGPVAWQQMYAHAYEGAQYAMHALWVRQHQPGVN